MPLKRVKSFTFKPIAGALTGAIVIGGIVVSGKVEARRCRIVDGKPAFRMVCKQLDDDVVADELELSKSFLTSATSTVGVMTFEPIFVVGSGGFFTMK